MINDKTDRSFMDRALKLAARGTGKTHPNPMVGAVLVAGGKIVGEGWHLKTGEPHAEIRAIRNAGRKSAGSTLYVNLEPCNHHGRTPPCTDLIIESRIRRVVVGCQDSNPLVDGKGIERLRNSGIEVKTGVKEKDSRELNRAFLHSAKTGQPYITLKLASTLDGQIATPSGESKWITGEKSRKAVHMMRTRVDGVLVGVGTVLSDDPGLDARGVRIRNQPHRIILDPSLKTPLGSKIVQQASDGRTILVVDHSHSIKQLKPYRDMGIRFLSLVIRKKMFEWPDLADQLNNEGILHLLVEGGGKTAAWFIRQKAVMRLELFMSPRIIGGDGIPSIGDLEIRNLRDAPGFKLLRTRRLDEDVHITADLTHYDQ